MNNTIQKIKTLIWKKYLKEESPVILKMFDKIIEETNDKILFEIILKHLKKNKKSYSEILEYFKIVYEPLVRYKEDI